MKTVKISLNSAVEYLDTKTKLSARKILLDLKENVDTLIVSLAKNRNIRPTVLSNFAEDLLKGASSLRDLTTSKEDTISDIETKQSKKPKTSDTKTKTAKETKSVEELPKAKSRFPKKAETPKIENKESKSKFADLSKVRELSSTDAKSMIKKIRVDKKKRDELLPKFSFYCFSLLENLYAVTPYLEALKNDVPPKHITFGIPYMPIMRSKDIGYSRDFVAMVLPFKVEEGSNVKYMSISAVCSTRNPEVLRRDYSKATY